MSTARLTIAAQGPTDRLGRLLHEEDTAAQLALTLANVATVLCEARLSWRDVVALRVSTTDLTALGRVFDTLVEHLAEQGAGPTITVVEVPRLMLPGMTVSIDGLATHPHRNHPTPDHQESTMTLEADPTLAGVPAPGRATTAGQDAAALRRACGPVVRLPGDPGYDDARTPWNVAVDQRPAAVAVPATVEEAAAVVAAAARLGLRVAPQSTGHGAAALPTRLDDVVLVRTTGFASVQVDAARRTARVEGGAVWEQVVDAAAPHGLVALHGSSPDVGVSGYTLGGGIGWYARQLGLACNSVTAVELLDATGRLVRADADTEPDLFWAVRGGGGSFGLVTAVELRLFPVADAYAGMLLWDIADAGAVLRHWARWSATAPDEVTTSLRVAHFPPMPELPDFLRGRSVVIVDGAVLGDDDRAAGLLAGLRALGPELDTFARVPAQAVTRIHLDPEGPTPSVGAGTTLARLDDDAVDAFLAAFGAGSGTSLLFAELRQLGGALARAEVGAGALARVDAAYAAFFVAIAATPELAAAGARDAHAGVRVMAPWSEGRTFLNLTEHAVDPSTAYPVHTWQRLRAIRRSVDPQGVFLASHPVPPS
jgi:FAD/FMN-containing dehydrogenase/enamine deaminase RidA (YjgF/YER057c/UK114 family)